MPSSSAAATAAGHARTVRRGASPRGPRRVSGPARAPKRNAPLRPVATNAGAVALPRPRTRTRTAPGTSLGARLLRRLVALPDSVWLGRLLRGRLWIALIATSLIGIVFMQVSLLKLNAGIGRAVQSESTLERQNSTLRAAISQLASNDRIQQFAQGTQMVLPAAGAVTFLGPDGRSVGGDAPDVAGDTAATGTLTPPPSGTAPDPATATTTATATATTGSTTPDATAVVPDTASTASTATTPTASSTDATTTAAPPVTQSTTTTQPDTTATTTAGGGVAAPTP